MGGILDWYLDARQWQVFHDLTLNEAGANVDHLVIGRPGVFTINTKNLGQEVWICGEHVRVGQRGTDYAEKAREEARQVHRRLQTPDSGRFWVTPVLAIVADAITVKKKPDGVEVVEAQCIHWCLESQPPCLADLEVKRLRHAAADWVESMAVSA